MTTIETAAPTSNASLPAADAQALVGLLQKGAAVEARKQAIRLSAAYPRASLPHKALGAIAALTGAPGQATSHFVKALDCAPEDKEARVNLARVMLENGVEQAGVDALKRAAPSSAAEMGPKDLLQEALVLCVGCDPNTARVRLHQALKHAPGDFELLDYYARILFSYPSPETKPEGVGAVLRILVDPRLENRGAQRVAAITLENELKRHAKAARAGEASELAKWFTPLLIAMLGHGFNTSLFLEAMLLDMRANLLRGIVQGEVQTQESLDIVEALARHSFQCEYLWTESEEETALVAALQLRVEEALQNAAPIAAAELYILGAYRELSRIGVVRDWVAAIARQNPQALEATLQKLVLEPLLEAEIAPKLPALTTIGDGVSAEVQAQYEQNPYPRWTAISRQTRQPFHQALGSQIAPNRTKLAKVDEPKVLIAGCGTGQHPIGAALRYENAQVIAIDLSRASLAYAARQSRVLGVTNVAFAQADILNLEGVDNEFDVIESSGVLHHMEDPEAGLERLLKALKPGGYLNLGLYSRLGRVHITKAREKVAELGYGSDADSIRRFRKDVASGALSELGDVSLSRDFYSISNLRDLVFHVQEHQFDLRQIKALLDKHDLEFLGFSCRSPHVIAAYGRENPQDPAQTDLDRWAAFEEKRPLTFTGMYQFWSRKR